MDAFIWFEHVSRTSQGRRAARAGRRCGERAVVRFRGWVSALALTLGTACGADPPGPASEVHDAGAQSEAARLDASRPALARPEDAGEPAALVRPEDAGARALRCDGAPCAVDGGLAQDDACPNDPNKRSPGACGCGVPDVDTDSDGTFDCFDLCPTDSLKIEQGICGCNVDEPDPDGDGVPDCIDECPDDPGKIELGVCGCGNGDSLGINAYPQCLDLAAALVHRYRFDDEGTTARDSVGSAHAAVVGTTLDGSGKIDLSGGDHVEVPGDALNGLGSATIEVWLDRGGGTEPDQRIFDFGASEGQAASGSSSVSLTPQTTPEQGGGVRLSYFASGAQGDVVLTGPSPLALNATSQVVCVFDEEGDTLELYVNGASVEQRAWSFALAQIDGANNWLGRSPLTEDPALDASIDELRIYATALTADQVQYSFESGPNPSFLE